MKKDKFRTFSWLFFVIAYIFYQHNVFLSLLSHNETASLPRITLAIILPAYLLPAFITNPRTFLGIESTLKKSTIVMVFFGASVLLGIFYFIQGFPGWEVPVLIINGILGVFAGIWIWYSGDQRSKSAS